MSNPFQHPVPSLSASSTRHGERTVRQTQTKLRRTPSDSDETPSDSDAFAVSVLDPSRREDGASDSDETPSDSDETPSDSDASAVSVLDPSRRQTPLRGAVGLAQSRTQTARGRCGGSCLGLRRDRTQTKLRRTQT